MRVLDLFSGIGGFSLGLERAGMTTAAFCEIDPKARLVLQKHWPDVPIFEDVTTLTAADMKGKIDVICGGFPCQDISLAGKGAGLAGDRSGLWFQFHRIIEEIRPPWVIIENVSALRSRGLDVILGGLAALGYDAEWHCIPASAVGAPHRRDRVWVVAYPKIDGRDGALFTSQWQAVPRSVESGADVAHSNGSSSRNRPVSGYVSNEGRLAARTGGATVQPSNRKTCADHIEQSGAALADSQCVRQSGSGQLGDASNPTQGSQGETVDALDGGFRHVWAAEPDVGRVANGVPNRMDRLKQLGNAVVPQIPELIGRAIMATCT
jgi:DNA (cytosine-5)-methyltransferase 1